MAGLTFYGVTKDLQQLLERQETMQIALLKLSRTYPSLKHDKRFKFIQQHNGEIIAAYQSLLEKYQEMNREVENTVTEPADYAIELARVVDTRLQTTCNHPTDSWIEVINVPTELRQYERDDKDWLCGLCGKLVPTF